MKKIDIFKFIIIYSFTLGLFTACVGTVQDSKVNVNSLSDETKQIISFPGLDLARPISHNKIELEFTPLGTDNPNYRYELFVNGSLSPITLNPSSLDNALGGRKRYVVNNLETNRDYKFILRLRDTLTGAESRSEKQVVATTFDNETADFMGITSVSKVTGMTSSAIKVEWVSAKIHAPLVLQDPDPWYYEVKVVEGNPVYLNDNNYNGSDKKVIKVPDNFETTPMTPSTAGDYTSVIIDHLSPSTTYYVQVRAVNKKWYNLSLVYPFNAIPVDREVNTKYLTIKTDPATGVFDFDDESFKVNNALGEKAFDTVVASWTSGKGNFQSYRIFYMKYSGTGDLNDTVPELLTEQVMDDITNKVIPYPNETTGTFVTTTPDKTSLSLSGLTSYAWYEFKILQCRDVACAVKAVPGQDQGSITSVARRIKIQPSLAPFEGIINIENPKDNTSVKCDNSLPPKCTAEITINFEPPLLSQGYADRLEVYCLDPSTATGSPNNFDFEPTPLSNLTPSVSSRTQCDKLKLADALALTSRKAIIQGVRYVPSTTDPTLAKYCFAIAPAIRDQGLTRQLPPAGNPAKDQWVVRCITPEVKTPNVAQFPGLTGSCQAVQDTIKLNWTTPAGGIYNKFKVFYRPILSNESFKFSDAVAGNPAYTGVSVADNLTTTTLTNLRPGTRYRVGVLSQLDMGTQPLYSEFNTAIQDCVTPMPTATFNEWTRVFAIGPKIDGRFPHVLDSNNSRISSTESRIIEALNVDGIPYEVKVDPNTNTIDSGSFLLAPGNYDSSYMPAGYSDEFDGAFGTVNSVKVAASQNGIVSLSWKDVSLNFGATEFVSSQDFVGAKKDRKYGYKIYRSADNQLSWQDLTLNTTKNDTPVFAKNYKYRKRPTEAETTERMAFFTDYSVQAMITDPEGIEKGRILWYKIVPFFNGKVLTYGGASGNPHIIRVILPPANMALMKREMANRNACLDLGREGKLLKDRSKHEYYSCEFSGVGARPKTTPWSLGNTVVDIGGDFLIDRYELGCQYTRGDVSKAAATDSASYYARSANISWAGDRSDLSTFTGFKTNPSDGSDEDTPLKGCTIGSSRSSSQDSSIFPFANNLADIDSVSGDKLSYKNVLFGDCLGNEVVSVPRRACSSDLYGDARSYKYPGALSLKTALDCEITDPDSPTNYAERLNADFRRNLMTQSEFAAVYYHRNRAVTSTVYPTGPGDQEIVSSSTWGQTKQCFINLAAIGADGNMRARWFPFEDINYVKNGANTQSLLKKTYSELFNDPNLYDNGEYKPLPNRLISAGSNRFDETTPIGKIATSNSAKLPPLVGLDQSIAQSVCSMYEVQVGVSTDGTHFLPTTLPQAKRLLRRQEFVMASRWPSAGSNTIQSYDYSDLNVRKIESDPDIASGGNLPNGRCNNGTRTFSSDIYRGSKLGPDTMTVKNGNTAISGAAHTGSSAQDSSTSNTEKCISEYGIQDLVGNVSETGPEKIFCDYTLDKIYFGQFSEGLGDVSNSVIIPDQAAGELLYWKNALIVKKNPDGSVKQEIGLGASGPNAIGYPNVTWALINTTSGYCSVVDDIMDAPKNQHYFDRYRDEVSNFYPVSFSNGTINGSMVIKQNTLDQGSIEYLRNGDGSFLNFGVDNLSPQINYNNSLSITDSGITQTDYTAQGTYFNPLIGMSMSCSSSSCKESVDNTLTTTPFLVNHLVNDDGRPEDKFNGFPIGNSQFFNDGISDTRRSHYKTDADPYFDLYFTTRPPRGTGTSVVSRIEIDSAGTVTKKVDDLSTFYDIVKDLGERQWFSDIEFVIPRGTTLLQNNGGSFGTSKTGRFTGTITTGSQYYYKQQTGNGIRCGVMINAD